MLTDKEKEASIAHGAYVVGLVGRGLIKNGDVITHTRCGGYIEEHVFAGLESDRCLLKAKATTDTKKFGGSEADDISPRCVTHVNRMPVESLEYCYQNLDRPYAASEKKPR